MRQEILQEYLDQGFCIVRGAFNARDVEAMRHGCDGLLAKSKEFVEDTYIGKTYFCLHRDANPFDAGIASQEPHKGVLRRVTYPYAVSEIFDQYRTATNLLSIVQQILG